MTTKKKIQEEEEKPNPGPGGVVGSTSTSISTTPPGPPDRISELPVEILHHILGFLEMDELLIGTSLVSTKWRYLWKSVSVLTFALGPRRSSSSSTRISGSGMRNNKVKKGHNFVDCVLRLRYSQASKIQIFNYYWFSSFKEYKNLEHLHNSIVSAVNQGAQEIQVQGYNLEESSNTIIHFTPSIFTSGLLRKFTFDVFLGNFLIQFPRSICCATQLTHLTLIGIRLPEGDDNEELHLVCPVLETFHMKFCYSEHLKVLDISAPKLNTLSIQNSSAMDSPKRLIEENLKQFIEEEPSVRSIKLYIL